ncbi:MULTISPECIES: GTP 3',8-cyclase MoaA [Shewanella]|uniref:GTP 3',8-cyclase n=2 Tax=Unclassified Bacteria TaxID=49928 RepID=A0AAU6VQT5_UNCXX|nr:MULTISPECIES: GTP 3',8-cyclase MoaA [Shewanella]MBO2626527.1 GTP 3',8-cyclase MoaA [Shewanella algae]MBZ4678536.1 cyclic pyranopterin phosphate synthase MoaA [Shewanella sp.]MCA0950383.1 GTP 3',8-cyclase MoaA [Shewanella chilikensis]MCE9852165.1 GTP 3',8-cyclase MoaA [Shewanella chilikensis]MCL1160962.1 GTP 3',8-cyclase MoaA [Shewanella chilikensis]
MNSLSDGFGRKIEYLRLSITDRCDFRCIYCMSEDPCFLEREQVLSLEELAFIGRAFTELGVSKIRLTGGEPLVRSDCDRLVAQLAALPGLKDLSMTSNGSRLAKLAPALKAAGLNRLNISLDTLKSELFTTLTRNGKLERVLKGIDVAKAAGFDRIKINAVILKGRNENEIIDLLEYCRQKQLDIAFIEEMPLGVMEERSLPRHMSSSDVREIINQRWPLSLSSKRTGGPARYYSMADSPIHIGFISPHSHNFCHECNRVRVTAEGRLLLCLGNEHSLDLKQIIRSHPGDIDVLKQAIFEAIQRKPKEHHFDDPNQVQILRFMNSTGG